jgi:hypothetical protein
MKGGMKHSGYNWIAFFMYDSINKEHRLYR